MIAYEQIKSVEIELSSYCNASCPLCPRNLFGYPYNSGYTVKHLTLKEIKKIFPKKFVQQLNRVNLEGNFGDFAMNPETPAIVSYLLKCNPDIQIIGHTNGSVQRKEYWAKLAPVAINFCIDGLAGTHEFYRRNTNWKTIITNAQAHIKSGGKAIWKMVVFDHNKDQIKDCKRLADNFGFSKFVTVENQRGGCPVFDKNGHLIDTIGNWNGFTDINRYLELSTNGDILLEDIDAKEKNSISCYTIDRGHIYISSIGEVYPCCYTAFQPFEYGKGRWHQPINAQLQELVVDNNALEHGIEKSIRWFDNVEDRWSVNKFEQGRLVVCDTFCGSCKQL